MFTTFIVQPIFNVLTLIYALLPGHNFGLAIILFTIVARMAFYPLLRKQLRHTKALKSLQPEIKKIKEKTKGDKKQESVLVMELYKEREIKPMAFIGLLAIQLVLFLALYSGLNRVVRNPQEIYDFSYSAIQQLPNMQALQSDLSNFDNSFLGLIDLTRPAISSTQGFYIWGFLLVLGSSVIMFFQIRQTSPSDPNARKLRDILKDASAGKEADTAEMNAVMSRNIAVFMPVLIFAVSLGFPAALALYWCTGNLIGFLQQAYLLRQEEFALTHATAEVVAKTPLSTPHPSVAKTQKKDTTTKKTKAGVTVTTYTTSEAKKASKVASRSKATKRKR